jgi:hypothetical protein
MSGLVLCLGLIAIPGARVQAGTGPLAGLQEATTKVGFDDQMPAKLSGLLWPTPGIAPKKCAVMKVGVEGTSEDDKRILIERVDNGDIVFAHIITSKPEADTKMRREYYYRANAKGGLALALTATFQFTITDVDDDVLKNVTSQTYGETAGDGTQPLAITPEIKAKFETEKKFWLKLEKSLKKKERDSGQ